MNLLRRGTFLPLEGEEGEVFFRKKRSNSSDHGKKGRSFLPVVKKLEEGGKKGAFLVEGKGVNANSFTPRQTPQCVLSSSHKEGNVRISLGMRIQFHNSEKKPSLTDPESPQTPQ